MYNDTKLQSSCLALKSIKTSHELHLSNHMTIHVIKNRTMLRLTECDDLDK